MIDIHISYRIMWAVEYIRKHGIDEKPAILFVVLLVFLLPYITSWMFVLRTQLSSNKDVVCTYYRYNAVKYVTQNRLLAYVTRARALHG